MGKDLIKCFVKQRLKNLPVNGDMMKTKAREINSRFKEISGGLNASDGWFTKFKKRFGVHHLRITNESVSVNKDAVDPI